ncbi:pyridoxamine 5'-phosphate oxidase [Nocardiopsis gilva YIM 90087]|uniref:Pyridoxine/pyridoxamine 5'-phosphate oxidase n=1 Tax=Nocardiopsis gilva YIM 90087 TaxID=1235441 RepID=A0A223S2B2_9ACTN|nr:pyridoxamine 5'-phosphate oxidase [Nocardiopsis gilva]ASU82265.1 pyridoxamine 5'-phosphate oxidase [Nocardiopsis gilva YIM 90087]
MNHFDPAELRESYGRSPLRLSDLVPHPMEQFHTWFTQVHGSGVVEPNAMILSTVEPSGAPRGRTVLMKGYDSSGLRFFTNYRSRKGRALESDPRVSVVFPWHPMSLQVMIMGSVERLSDAENDRYFRSRPRGSQIGAWASEQQSSPVEGRAELDERYERLRHAWPDGVEVPRPPYWGGYRVHPGEMEFWRGSPDRMHDRFRYLLVEGESADGRWVVERLSP